MAKKKGNTPPQEFEDAFERFINQLDDSTDIFSYRELMRELNKVSGYNGKLGRAWKQQKLQEDLINDNIDNAWTEIAPSIPDSDNIYRYDKLYEIIAEMGGIDDRLPALFEDRKYGENIVDQNVNREWVKLATSPEARELMKKAHSDTGVEKVYYKIRKHLVEQHHPNQTALYKSRQQVIDILTEMNRQVIEFNKQIVEGIKEKNRIVRGIWNPRQSVVRVLELLQNQELRRKDIDTYMRENQLGTERELTPMSKAKLIEQGSQRGRWVATEKGREILRRYREIQ